MYACNCWVHSNHETEFDICFELSRFELDFDAPDAVAAAVVVVVGTAVVVVVENVVCWPIDSCLGGGAGFMPAGRGGGAGGYGYDGGGGGAW